MRPNPQKQALYLAYFTVGYNILECLVSVAAGYLAGSIALVGFGLDSLVESLSGGVIVWRFVGHAGLSPEEEARREARAIKIVGWTFFVLAAYVGYEAVKKLLFREIPSPTLLGLIIATVSLILMPVLYVLKHRLGHALGSASLMADAKETMACAFLSVALLVGLGLNYLWGFWQADHVIALLIVAVLGREGYHTLKAKKLCSCASCGLERPG